MAHTVDALTRLRHHPHVIAYRTCFVTSTVFTIITDYAAGGTLGAQIRRAKRRRLSSAGGTAAATAGSAPAGDASNAPAGAPADQGDDAARLAAASAAAPAAAAANPAALGDATAAVAPPFESSLLVRWASQLLSALGAVHDLRMMHRDVKPHNVFLTADLHIKLGDFGLARELSDHPSELGLSACGTPYYMSPEQVRGEAYARQADVWALGCVLFELLTLERAFAANSFSELARLITETGADGEGGRARRDALLRACAASEPAVPRALIALTMPDALLHHTASKRMTLRGAAEALAPLLEPAERDATLGTLLAG